MEVVIFDGLALKEELILERRGSHSGLMLGPAASVHDRLASTDGGVFN